MTRAYEPMFEVLCDQIQLCDRDLRCGACGGSGQEPDSADPYFGTRMVGCGDCQGSGRVLPPDDMEGEPRTHDDLDDETAIERGDL